MSFIPRYCLETPTSYKNKIPYGNNSETGKYVVNHNTKIYYEMYGQGKPIVVSHSGVIGSIQEMGELIDNCHCN